MSMITGAIVKRQERVAGYSRLTLQAEAVASNSRPGQFLHVRCGDTLDPLLRRPISIHAVDREKGEITLLYRVAGKGTALLSEKKEGERISLLGPLGRGFSMPAGTGGICVVAGGIGIAPLYFLLRELSRRKIYAAAFLGAPTGRQLICADEIKELGHTVFPATDDGSAGFHGTVAELFDLYSRIPADGCGGGGRYAGQPELPGKPPFEMVYACGPKGMLKEVCEILSQANINGEIAFEERMGCGLGACLSCVCKTVDAERGFRYRRTCVDGPVFPAGEVIWD